MWIVYICLIGILGFGVWQCWICRVPFFVWEESGESVFANQVLY